jgi:hypothetical protein
LRVFRDRASLAADPGLWASIERALGGSTWSPAWTANLAFEHAELVTKGEDLGAEPGVRVAADDEDLEQKTDDGVGEGAEHDPGASQSPAGPGR